MPWQPCGTARHERGLDVRILRRMGGTAAEEKFLRYRSARRRLCPLDISRVHADCERGLVSVILPVWNGADYLEEAVSSVLNQAYRQLELIAVDDGSTDSTPEILARFAKADGRVRVLTQPNLKLPSALNRGFAAARGEFLTWISADNIMLPECLAVLVSELQQAPKCAMVFGNMQLIDAQGRLLRGHGWFELPPGSGNVCLPRRTACLNTVANNTVGAAFLYRASAAAVAGGYSVHKFGMEDYDYWMRLNELSEIAHTGWKRPLYLYRMHSRSLTAQDEKLGITANRYKLMLLDDFRRDFLCAPVPTAMQGVPDALQRALRQRGHSILPVPQAADIYALTAVSFDGALPDGIPVRAQVLPKDGGYCCRFYGGYAESAVWCDTLQSLADVLDAGLRGRYLALLEAAAERGGPYEKRLSVVVCTDGRAATLAACLQAVCMQLPAEAELLVVDNAPQNPRCKMVYQTLRQCWPQLCIRYLSAPVTGLSYARNTALWAADGAILLYLDDDAIAGDGLLQAICGSFASHPEAGVIGGQIVLEVPDGVPEKLLRHGRGLWSEFLIPGGGYRQASSPAEFPYGACFGVRTQPLRQLGGFRTRYGRVGEDYGGGEELQVCHAMAELGLKVGLCPAAQVVHRVDRSRFTAEHVRRTRRAAEATRQKLREDFYF